VPPNGPPRSASWLRASVSRFSTGADHERRRALVTRVLAGIDPAALAEAARAHPVPIDVLAEAVGAAPAAEAAGAVAVVARVYLSGDPDPAADRAVARLVTLLGGTADEATANRIGLLVQAYPATVALVERAGHRLAGSQPVEAILDETLRHDPPVRSTRRIATRPLRIGESELSAGALVELDLAEANRDPEVFADPDRFDPDRAAAAHLTFGAGLRPCPGRAHALALASGALRSDLPGSRP
jgi:Cytochrome P450